MLDPRTILVAVPCYDGKLMAELAGGLLSSLGLFAATTLPTECSHISLQRNLIAAQFMDSRFQWLVCIDSDTVPSRGDMELLLEPCDSSIDYAEDLERALDQDPRFSRGHAPPCPSRITLAQVTPGRPLSEQHLAAADVLVAAEYSFKNDTLEPVKLGMGFVRIHRSVFERLQQLKHDGGSTIEVRRDLFERLQGIHPGKTGHYPRAEVDALLASAEDKAGQPRLWQVSHKGRMVYDYFPSGPLLSQFVPSAEWKGEDHGFFTLCMLAGIIPRIETRTRLIHMGRKGYPYLGPDQGGGQ